MATQQDEGVPFAIAHDLQQFRLLELPKEIVELIDSPSPPHLSIKSQAPAAISSAPNAKPAYAVFCTPNKTYQLRQVQTSNSVFITQPTTFDVHGNEIPVPATQAIASCTTTLELHPIDASAASLLEEVLPVYDIIDGEVDVVGNGETKDSILANMPLSKGQLEQGWIEHVAFEVGGSSYRPSANTFSQVWRSINSAALAEGIKLDTQFLTHDMAKDVAEEGYPGDLVTAICKKLARDDQDLTGQWSCLDSGKTVRLVGTNLLQARAGNHNYPLTDFLEAWKDALPESWRKEAELSAIDGVYVQPTSTTISVKGAATNTTKFEDRPAPKAASRKWHEKFGRARKR